MFLLGHLAWGYLLGRAASKGLKKDVNLPLLFALSILPDADFFILGVVHHGPTHSIVLYTVIFIPLFIKYRQRAVPYFVALAQHIVADLPSLGGIMLLWPIVPGWFTAVNELGRTIFVYYSNYTVFDISLEWVGFLLSLVLLVKWRDLFKLFTPRLSNLILLFPAGAILLSFFFEHPSTPIEIAIPGAVFLMIFCFSALSPIIYRIRRLSAHDVH
jgi:hypothetical protein